MIRLVVASALVILPCGGQSFARDGTMQEGRSVGTCSRTTLVCAISKTGSMKPTDECSARQDAAARIVPGDCYDPD